jgi:hypothetical protein
MGHAFWTGFGVVFALLAAGGYVLLRWQSDRHRFLLVRLALERGIPLPSAGPPYWVDSLRAGVLTLALGLGLLLAGGAATAMALRVPRPDETGRLPAAAADEPAPTFDKGRGPPRRPPPPNLAHEEWRRAQSQRSLGLASLAAGLVLSLLGGVRIGFAQYERKFSPSDSRWELPRADLGPASGAPPLEGDLT